MAMYPDPNLFPQRAEELLARPVTAAEVPALLAANDELNRDVDETYSRLSRAKDEDTTDEAAAAAYLGFVTGILPEMQVLDDRMARKLLAVEGYEPPADLSSAWADMQEDVELFREENVPLITKLDELGQKYSELKGSMVIELDGERLTYDAAQAKLQEPDRALRERAYRAIDAAREAQRAASNEIFQEMLALRHRMARNAGLEDFREYQWRAYHRREYTPQDCLDLHDTVAEVVVPRLREVYERRRRIMELPSLRPYDLYADARGRAALKPFATVKELEEGLKGLFHAVGPQVGDAYELLLDGWMDLEARPGKVPGLGYQAYFPRSQRPYIYMNAVGTDDDLLTMRHEMGHALHTLLTQARWPLLVQHMERAEMDELASQALELLSLPYLEKSAGGFYDPEDAQRSRSTLLVRVLELLVWACRLDAIQHWIYTHEGLRDGSGPTPAQIDAQWASLAERFSVGVDISGFESERSRDWQYFHVFQVPFYYLEYAIAYLGALQVWERARVDQEGALADYLEALSLGATRPLDELYRVAGVSFDVGRDMVARLTDLVVRELGDEV